MRQIALVIAILAYTFLIYQIGYAKAEVILAKNWYEGPEGYCFADVPQHPGHCYGE